MSLQVYTDHCHTISVTGGPCRSMHHSLTVTAGPCSSMHHCPDTSNVALSLEAMQMHHCPYSGPCRCATVKTWRHMHLHGPPVTVMHVCQWDSAWWCPGTVIWIEGQCTAWALWLHVCCTLHPEANLRILYAYHVVLTEMVLKVGVVTPPSGSTPVGLVLHGSGIN